MSIDLSVLICSTHTRADTFGKAIQQQVWPQYETLPAEYRDRIEILMLTDTKSIVLGEKRNHLLRMAQGKYVVFVDDDDRIEPDMFTTLLDAAATDADAICFDVMVSMNGKPPKVCKYSKNFPGNRNFPNRFERWPNSRSMIRRELALQALFPPILCGEDTVYAERLRPLLSTEHQINRALYHYDFNSKTTETQFRPVADVVILSNGYTSQLRDMTQKTIDTCRETTDKTITVSVIEQHPKTTYRGAATLHKPGPFNYNRSANHGALLGTAPWIVIANNDLIFHQGWLDQLLKANKPLVSPKCPKDSRQTDITRTTAGTQNGKHFSGWCFMISRDLWKNIGGFDECVSFWCSDDVVIAQSQQQGVTPVIVPAAKVEHLHSTTLKQSRQRDELTWAQLDIYIQKYGPHQLQKHPGYVRWKQRNST